MVSSQPIFKGKTFETFLMLQTADSMTKSAAQGETVERRAILHQAFPRIVDVLSATTAPSRGIRAIACGDEPSMMGVSNENPSLSWDSLQWGGEGQLVPGWQLLVSAYQREFGSASPSGRPGLLACVLMDGETADTHLFAQRLKEVVSSNDAYAAVGILGFGPKQQEALAEFQALSKENNRIATLDFAGITDPTVISDSFARLINTG